MKLSKEDYVILKDGVPISPLDVILHYTSIVEMFNDGQRLYEGEEIVCMTELPQKLQDEYIKEIKENK